MTMVSDDQALEGVTLGPGGLLTRLGDGIHLSMSTIAPCTARRLAPLHRERGQATSLRRFSASPKWRFKQNCGW